MEFFEVRPDDTTTTGRSEKLTDYAALAFLRCQVLLEQISVGTTLLIRDPVTPDLQRALRR
jgi:hypothetical protein